MFNEIIFHDEVFINIIPSVGINKRNCLFTKHLEKDIKGDYPE